MIDPNAYVPKRKRRWFGHTKEYIEKSGAKEYQHLRTHNRAEVLRAKAKGQPPPPSTELQPHPDSYYNEPPLNTHFCVVCGHDLHCHAKDESQCFHRWCRCKKFVWRGTLVCNMLKITLPADADLSIFDDVLRRPELIQALIDCGVPEDQAKEVQVVATKPIDILAITAEHIRDTDIIPAGGVFENLNDDGTTDCIRVKCGNRGLIRYKDQGPELNLMKPNPDKPKTWIVHSIARPEDPQFFDVIDDFCHQVLSGWHRIKLK